MAVPIPEPVTRPSVPTEATPEAELLHTPDETSENNELLPRHKVIGPDGDISAGLALTVTAAVL